MTVRELINELSQYGDDVEVLVFNQSRMKPVPMFVYDAIGEAQCLMIMEDEDEL